jgi:CRP/FNR family transcriptional regulator
MIGPSDVTFLAGALPYWKKLKENEKQIFIQNMRLSRYKRGENIHSAGLDCEGLMVVKSGRLRVYLISGTGREATLYRPAPGETCIFTASCIMRNIDFDVFIDADADSEVYILPVQFYQEICKLSKEAEDFTNQVIAARFSDVMWVMEQILFTSMDKRLALFLLEKSEDEKTDTLSTTHESIAGHLGSAREVISRMLKYFEREGMVRVFRGGIKIVDLEKLKKTAGFTDR